MYAQEAIAEQFDVNVPAFSKHLPNIFEEGKLEIESTISKSKKIKRKETSAIINLINIKSLHT